MLKLSIIIPVYNVAPYVRKCVESVLNQDLDPKECEVILVDDGSTDGSGEICDSLTASQPLSPSASQPNIKVIHQENQGLSAARNVGIAVAKGKYVQFVDSDDYLEPNVLGGLVEQMEREELDVLRFDYQNVRLTPCPSPEERGENSANSPSPEERGVNNGGGDTHLYRETGDGINYPLQKEHARDMRKNPTDAENVLWQLVRNNQLGYKIRRQHPINEFIADFICLEAQLIIEVDGGYHLSAEQMEEDARRTRILNDFGFEILRFANAEVLLAPDQTCIKIKSAIEDRIQHKPFISSTSLSSGEGRGEAIYEVFEPNKTPRKVDRCTKIVDGEMYLNTRMGYACYAVQFMIRRELLDGCVFTRGIYLEDTEWTPRMLMKAKRVNATDTVVYNYLTRDGSIMRNVDKAKKVHLIESLFIVNETLRKLMQTATSTRWLQGNRSDNAYSILGNVARYDYANRKMWLEKLRASGVYPLVPYLCKRNTRIKYKIINLSPALYCWLIHKHVL